jgi:hypothetical protein
MNDCVDQLSKSPAKRSLAVTLVKTLAGKKQIILFVLVAHDHLPQLPFTLLRRRGHRLNVVALESEQVQKLVDVRGDDEATFDVRDGRDTMGGCVDVDKVLKEIELRAGRDLERTEQKDGSALEESDRGWEIECA